MPSCTKLVLLGEDGVATETQKHGHGIALIIVLLVLLLQRHARLFCTHGSNLKHVYMY